MPFIITSGPSSILTLTNMSFHPFHNPIVGPVRTLPALIKIENKSFVIYPVLRFWWHNSTRSTAAGGANTDLTAESIRFSSGSKILKFCKWAQVNFAEIVDIEVPPDVRTYFLQMMTKHLKAFADTYKPLPSKLLYSILMLSKPYAQRALMQFTHSPWELLILWIFDKEFAKERHYSTFQIFGKFKSECG